MEVERSSFVPLKNGAPKCYLGSLSVEGHRASSVFTKRVRIRIVVYGLKFFLLTRRVSCHGCF